VLQQGSSERYTIAVSRQAQASFDVQGGQLGNVVIGFAGARCWEASDFPCGW
jgi:hypothetical protein